MKNQENVSLIDAIYFARKLLFSETELIFVCVRSSNAEASHWLSSGSASGRNSASVVLPPPVERSSQCT